jgi:hypothetical protein
MAGNFDGDDRTYIYWQSVVVNVHFLLFSHFRNSSNCHRNGTTDKSCTLSSSYEWQNIHVDVRKNENLKMYIAFTKEFLKWENNKKCTFTTKSDEFKPIINTRNTFEGIWNYTTRIVFVLDIIYLNIMCIITLSTVKFLSFIITDCQYMYVRSSPSKFPAIINIAADG